MVCITLGTGIGGGLVIGGKFFRGTYGMAGEWGHMISVPGGHWCECGNRGCWEQYASGNALVREARAFARTNSPTAYRLLEIVGGDPDESPGRMSPPRPSGESNSMSCWPMSGPGWVGASPISPPPWIRGRGNRRRGQRRGRAVLAARPTGVQPDVDGARFPRGGQAGAGALPQRCRADRRGRSGRHAILEPPESASSASGHVAESGE